MRNAGEALERFTAQAKGRVLEIGSGLGEHTAAMRKAGLSVETCDLKFPADFACAFDSMPARPNHYGGVWASHVLEHERNPGAFLDRCFLFLKPAGLFGVTVPPMNFYDGRITAGHLSFWNAGLLLYHLVLAGFDCSRAQVHTYGKNVSVIVAKTEARLPSLLSAKPDLENLARFFPVPVHQGFQGDIVGVNW